jgi:putative FmdB family regulatory protein
MPLQLFVCTRCSTRFEELVREGDRIVCPQCSNSRVERQLSTFAVRGESSRPIGRDMPEPMTGPGGPCGSCGDPRGARACRFED